MTFISFFSKSFLRVERKTFIPFLIIFIKEANVIYFVDKLLNFHSRSNLSLEYWLALQVIFSIVFGFLSDRYCRKKTLVLCLGVTLISLLLLKYDFLLPAILLNGIFGNFTCIARAAYCDINVYHNRMTNIENTFFPQALAWIVFFIDYKIFSTNLFFTVFFLNLIAFLLSLLFFKDFRDKSEKKKEVSFFALVIKFFDFSYIRLIIAMIIWQGLWHMTIAIGAMYMKQIDQGKYLFLVISSVYFLGLAVTKFYKIRPLNGITISILLTFLFFFFNFIVYLLTGSSGDLPYNIFLLLSFFMGISRPLYFVCFAKKAEIHEQGTLYGFLESAISFAFFLAPLFLDLQKPFSPNRFVYFIPLLALCYLLVFRLPKVAKDLKEME